MKITKVHRIYHSKTEIRGKLLSLQQNKKYDDTKKLIIQRFNETIESRIYKEFLRLAGNEKLSTFKKYYLENPYINLYHFIHQLYLGEKNTVWEIKHLRTIDLTNINEKNCKYIFTTIKKETKEILFQYKITKHDYFYSSEAGKTLPFKTLLHNFIQEVKENNVQDNTTAETLESYKKLKDLFELYKKSKIAKIQKSIEHNKIPVELPNNQVIYKTKNLQALQVFFTDLLKEAMQQGSSNDFLQNKLDSCAQKIRLEEHYTLFISTINTWENENNSAKDKRTPQESLRRTLLTKSHDLQANDRENHKENPLHKETYIYFEEFIKYVELILSKNKQEMKGKKSREKGLLDNYIKKALFSSYERFKAEIDSRFKNRFTSFILDYGKRLYYKQYDVDNSDRNTLVFSSEDMEYIKAKESFTRKIATLISFATHAFYHIFTINLEEQKDILGAKYTGEVYEKLNKEKLNYFFTIKDVDKNFILALSEAIYTFRNGVVHFKDISFEQLKNKYSAGFEIATELLQNQIETLPQQTEEIFMSNNLEYYYTTQELKLYFAIYCPAFPKKNVPFAPNFKRITNKGKKLAQHDASSYPYWQIDSQYKDHLHPTIPSYVSVKNFLLKEVYYNNFLSEFLSSVKDFKTAIKKASKRKEDTHTRKKGSGESYEVLKAISFPSTHREARENISEYLSTLHKVVIDRENLHRFEKNVQKEKSLYVSEFIEDIFLEGFITWLNDKQLSFLQDATTRTMKENITSSNREAMAKFLQAYHKQWESVQQADYTDPPLIALYLLLSMLDTVHLSQFKHEIIRYQQFYSKRFNKTKATLFSIPLEQCITLCEIIILTSPKLDSKKNTTSDNNNPIFSQFYKTRDEYNTMLKQFIDEDTLQELIEKQHGLYYAEDKETPIVHANIEKTRKFATQYFLANIIEIANVKYTIQEREKKEKIKIEELHKTNTRLHKQWVNSTKNKENFTEEDRGKYSSAIKCINCYNYLQRKETLQTVFTLHSITSDLMGRFVAFIHKWERDFKFFMLAVREEIQQVVTPNTPSISTIIEKFLSLKKNSPHFNANYYLSKQPTTNKNSLYWKLQQSTRLHEDIINPLLLNLSEEQIEQGAFTSRNYISHFAHMNHFYGKDNVKIKKACQYSFIDQMNALIQLFSYDRKTQNHINKAVKTVLAKYNIEIEFEIDEEKNKEKNTFTYKIKEIKSTTVQHLKKDKTPLTIPLVDDEFLTTVRTLLEYKEGYLKNEKPPYTSPKSNTTANNHSTHRKKTMEKFNAFPIHKLNQNK